MCGKCVIKGNVYSIWYADIKDNGIYILSSRHYSHDNPVLIIDADVHRYNKLIHWHLECHLFHRLWSITIAPRIPASCGTLNEILQFLGTKIIQSLENKAATNTKQFISRIT